MNAESTPGEPAPTTDWFTEYPGIQAKVKRPRRAWQASASWVHDGWTNHESHTIHARTKLGARWKARRMYPGATTRSVQPAPCDVDRVELGTGALTKHADLRFRGRSEPAASRVTGCASTGASGSQSADYSSRWAASLSW